MDKTLQSKKKIIRMDKKNKIQLYVAHSSGTLKIEIKNQKNPLGISCF